MRYVWCAHQRLRLRSEDGAAVGGASLPAVPWYAAEVEELVEHVRRDVPHGCIIVAGSAGSNELTRDADGRLLSDVEIGVAGGMSALRAARRLTQQGVGEVFWVSPWRLRWGLERNIGSSRPTVRAYDLARSPRIGPVPLGAGNPRRWQANDLDSREAVTILSNRIGEVIEKRTPYTLAKVAAACGDALLIIAGLYEAGYRQRLNSLDRLPVTVPPRVKEVARTGYVTKLGGDVHPVEARDVESAVQVVLEKSVLASSPKLSLNSWTSLHGAFSATSDASERRGSGYAAWIDVIGLMARGSRVLGPAESLRFICHWRRPSDAIFAALVRVFSVGVRSGRPLSHAFHVPEDVPRGLAPNLPHLLKSWRAFS
jgi:hypothetical protein